MAALSSILQLDVSGEECARAQWATKVGGLGLRSCHKHAHVAFMSRVLSTVDLQSKIWPEITRARVLSDPCVIDAFSALQSCIPQSLAALLANGEPVPQKMLSHAIDRASFNAVLGDMGTEEHMKAHLQLVSAEGADAWLHATPNDEAHTKVSSELFKISVARRLRMRLLHEHSACPCCGAGMDVFMDHALVCPCGGDRTLRHNALRDCFFRFVVEFFGIKAQKEKQGLLPARPQDESVQGDVLRSGLRPADVWLPSYSDGKPCAVDFAVTSGLRSDCVRSAANDPSPIWEAYENFKRRHADTATRCSDQGMSFEPFVVEAHGGGFGVVARRICAHVAKVGAAKDGCEVEVQAASLFRSMSISVHRENARAVLRRLTPPSTGAAGPHPDAWADSPGAIFQ
jgi:hypothetical protein